MNKSISTLLADGLATSSPARRLAIYEQVLKRVATEVPYGVLFSPNASAAACASITRFPDVSFETECGNCCYHSSFRTRLVAGASAERDADIVQVRRDVRHGDRHLPDDVRECHKASRRWSSRR